MHNQQGPQANKPAVRKYALKTVDKKFKTIFAHHQAPVQEMTYPSECPMSAENGSLLVNTPNDVNPLNMVRNISCIKNTLFPCNVGI